LRFFGNGTGLIDRVRIALDGPARPVDVGAADFSLEFWIRAEPGANQGVATTGNDGWITGNVFLDRDVWGPGDFGDFGASLSGGRVAWGVSRGPVGETIVSSRSVATGRWIHVLLQRRFSDGWMTVHIDGWLDASGLGPSGDVSYRDGRNGFPQDPFLVLGAEKHDAGPAYPSFSGWIADLRVSNRLRADGVFYPVPLLGHKRDQWTAALYRFSEGSGPVLHDTSGRAGGPSHGEIRYGGAPFGPVWDAGPPLLRRLAGQSF
jgi:hypothetical protein